MTEEEIIKQYRLGPDSRVKFKNDPQQYWIKNISPDRKNVFVHINGAQTYRKLIKNIVQVDNKKLKIEEGESLKNLVIQKIQSSDLSQEQKDKLIKCCEDPKQLNKVLMSIDKDKLKEQIRSTLKELNIRPSPGSIQTETQKAVNVVKDQLGEFLDSTGKGNSREEQISFFAENIVGLVKQELGLEEKTKMDEKQSLNEHKCSCSSHKTKKTK